MVPGWCRGEKSEVSVREVCLARHIAMEFFGDTNNDTHDLITFGTLASGGVDIKTWKAFETLCVDIKNIVYAVRNAQLNVAESKHPFRRIFGPNEWQLLCDTVVSYQLKCIGDVKFRTKDFLQHDFVLEFAPPKDRYLLSLYFQSHMPGITTWSCVFHRTCVSRLFVACNIVTLRRIGKLLVCINLLDVWCPFSVLSAEQLQLPSISFCFVQLVDHVYDMLTDKFNSIDTYAFHQLLFQLHASRFIDIAIFRLLSSEDCLETSAEKLAYILAATVWDTSDALTDIACNAIHVLQMISSAMADDIIQNSFYYYLSLRISYVKALMCFRQRDENAGGRYLRRLWSICYDLIDNTSISSNISDMFLIELVDDIAALKDNSDWETAIDGGCSIDDSTIIVIKSIVRGQYHESMSKLRYIVDRTQDFVRYKILSFMGST